MKKRNYICGTLAVVWMIIIFSFSARTSDVSTNDSNRIGLLIGKTFIHEFNEWEEEKQIEFAKKIDHPIRKTAHAMEYAVLGALVAGTFITLKRTMASRILIPWLIATIYAASDEFHQLFVAGRSGQVSDVMLDSTGVMAGVLIIVFILWKKEKYSNSRMHFNSF
ncbi:MAG: VanZ family protein [bacterium]|nr:VanZ family protein [bacterium]